MGLLYVSMLHWFLIASKYVHDILGVLPAVVQHLESLGIFWQLRSDVVALHEDWPVQCCITGLPLMAWKIRVNDHAAEVLQTAPVNLKLSPDLERWT